MAMILQSHFPGLFASDLHEQAHQEFAEVRNQDIVRGIGQEAEEFLQRAGSFHNLRRTSTRRTAARPRVASRIVGALAW